MSPDLGVLQTSDMTGFELPQYRNLPLLSWFRMKPRSVMVHMMDEAWF